MKFWKLGVYSLGHCTGSLQRPGKVISKAAHPPALPWACCSSFLSQGEGFEKQYTHRLS